MDLPSNKAAPNGANAEGTSGAYAAPSVPNFLSTLAVATRDPQELARSLQWATGFAGDRSTNRACIAAAAGGASSELEAGVTASSRDDARGGQGGVSEQEMELRKAISEVKNRQELAERSRMFDLYFIGIQVNAALYVAEDRDAALERISEECGLSSEELEQCADVAHVFRYDGIMYLLDHRATLDRPLSIAAIADFARTAERLAEAKWSLVDLMEKLDDEWKKATEWALGADFETPMNALDALYLDLGARARKVLAVHELDKLPASSWRMRFDPR